MKPFPTPEALAADEAFQDWVRHPDAPADAQWAAYLRQFPDQQALVDEARHLVTRLHFDRPELSAEAVAGLRSRILTSLDEEPEAGKVVVRPLWRRWSLAIAASVAALLVAGWFWLNRPNMIQRDTEYGQIRQLTLPDGSLVTLNAHSSLRYAKNLAALPLREVWIEGEGFFNVRHLTSNVPFRVHTSRLDVDVLGTEFNVSDRLQTTRVVLVQGRVKVARTDRAAPAAVLAPGDLAETGNSVDTGLVQRRVRPALYAAWRQHRWVLDDTPMAEVAQRLQDTFGKPVVFAQPEFATVKVNGVVSTENLDELLGVLSGTLGLRLSVRGKQILVTN